MIFMLNNWMLISVYPTKFYSKEFTNKEKFMTAIMEVDI
jgi:hypothetical protein